MICRPSFYSMRIIYFSYSDFVSSTEFRTAGFYDSRVVLYSHENALNAIHWSAAHGTLVNAPGTRTAYTHVKAWNDCVVLGVGEANATRVQHKAHGNRICSLHVAADVYAVEMRTRASRRLRTRVWWVGWRRIVLCVAVAFPGCCTRTCRNELLLCDTPSCFVDVSIERHITLGEVPECDQLR